MPRRSSIPCPAPLRTIRRALTPILAACLLLLAPAHAQPTGDLEPVIPTGPFRPAPDTQPELMAAPVTAIEFAPDPLIISQHGLRLRVPLDWIVERRDRDAASARLVDFEHSRDGRLILKWTPLAQEESSITELSPIDGSVMVRIQVPLAADPAATLDQLAQTLGQKVVDSAAADAGAGAEAYAIFEKDPALQIAGRPAYRFYMRIPRRSHETGLVLGYTLMDLPGPHFLVMEMLAPEENYLAARPQYETVVAALEFINPADIDARRWPLMLAASRFMASRTPDDYDAAMRNVDGRMERLFAPGGSGADGDDSERGVRRVFCWRGMRGEIDPEKPRESYTEVEQEEGYIVFVGGRYFDWAENPVDGSRERVVADFAARYWMSLDREREAWVNRMLIKTPAYPRPVPFTEIGARNQDSLTVWTKPAGEAERVIRPVFEPQGYISQVEFFLFADMLAKAGIPTDFGYYAWQTGASTCRFIHDAALPEADGLAWTILRTFGDGEETHHIAFDGETRWRGTRREVGQSVTRGEPTDVDRLMQLWESKGLPTENMRDPGPRRDDRPSFQR